MERPASGKNGIVRAGSRPDARPASAPRVARAPPAVVAQVEHESKVGTRRWREFGRVGRAARSAEGDVMAAARSRRRWIARGFGAAEVALPRARLAHDVVVWQRCHLRSGGRTAAQRVRTVEACHAAARPARGVAELAVGATSQMRAVGVPRCACDAKQHTCEQQTWRCHMRLGAVRRRAARARQALRRQEQE